MNIDPYNNMNVTYFNEMKPKNEWVEALKAMLFVFVMMFLMFAIIFCIDCTINGKKSCLYQFFFGGSIADEINPKDIAVRFK